MSRADRAQREREAEERDRLAHERPVEYVRAPVDPDAFAARNCVGNRSGFHQRAAAKRIDVIDGQEVAMWRCDSCYRWLKAPPPKPFIPYRLPGEAGS